MHYQPEKLTSFDKHFGYDFNVPIVTSTEVDLVKSTIGEEDGDASSMPDCKDIEGGSNRFDAAIERAEERQVYDSYIENSERLKRGEISIAGLQPGSEELHRAEFLAYVQFDDSKFLRRQGRADRDPEDAPKPKAEFYAEAISMASTDTRSTTKYTQMPEIALWQSLANS